MKLILTIMLCSLLNAQRNVEKSVYVEAKVAKSQPQEDESLPDDLIQQLATAIEKGSGRKQTFTAASLREESLSKARSESKAPSQTKASQFFPMSNPFNNICTMSCKVCLCNWDPICVWQGFWCLVKKMHHIFKCLDPSPITCPIRKNLIRNIFANYLSFCTTTLRNVLINWFNFVIQNWC